MRKPFAIVAALILAAAAGGCSRPKGYDDSFGRHVHAYLLDHPEVIQEMEYAAYMKAQTLKAAQIRPLISKYHSQIYSDPRDPSVGPANAKVTVVQFFDYRCPHCKAEAAPAVLDMIKRYPDVRFVFKEFPIFGPPSRLGSRAGLAAFKAGHYLPVFAGLMREEKVDQTTIDSVMAAAGIPKAQADALMNAPQTDAQITEVQTLALNLGIDGTPAFFIGDNFVNGADMKQVDDLIQAARKK